jgi:RNA polymerase sporulation-specific sigma factor
MGQAYISLDNEPLTDEQLVARAQAGDRRAERQLLRRFRSLVHKRCQPYFLNGAERDDLLQEGLIGLHKAIRDFRPGQGHAFLRFAATCVNRQVVTAVRQATRQKHMPLATYASLSETDAVEQPLELLDLDPGHDPHDEFLDKDGLDWVKAMLRKHLSGFEQQVLALYLKGASYREIALSLKKNAKAIDNALARIKEKGRVLQLQVAFT